ncbi:MAG: magnesium transporter [Bacillota bacterium]|nr:magnesium/cobalt transporter CorA [Bacillota bacterium]MDI6637808.1 magnesium/cobalt transporter CorA [Bacillota bacterium]MDK2930153.1 magnesium transporter [Bacillota bacterium]
MVRAFLFGGPGKAAQPLEGESEIEEAARRGEGVLWVDLQAPAEDEFEMLSRVFRFHPLSIEDCRTYSELPKVDEFSEYLFVVTHYVACTPDDAACGRLSLGELDIFIGHTFVVTVHTQRAGIVDQCVKRFREHPDMPAMGPDFLVYALLDALVDSFFPLVDRWDDRLDEIEEGLLLGRTRNVLQRLTTIRRNILRARKSVAPTRDVVGSLARRDVAFISEQAAWYFRDVSDHLLRVHGMLDSARDAVASLFELYLSISSHRANLVMQRLTIVATIFLPLTFIAGVYGMNFRYMPELEWRYGYLMVWIVMLLVGGGFLVYFKRRGWF